MIDYGKRYMLGVDQPPAGWETRLPRRDDSPKDKAAALMTDAFLLRAYQRTPGELGDPEADALLGEIERRGLDV